jgi:hypothetical protein
VEFSLVVPIAMLLLLGMLEFGFVFDHSLTLSYATREGARIGSALANGGGTLGCSTGQSPNAASVDPEIAAAVQRVITSPGSQVALARVSEIRIYRATTGGAEMSGLVNVWQYAPGDAANPTVDGVKLSFKPVSVGWPACQRSNAQPAHSIGIRVQYTYNFSTPIGAVAQMFGGSLPITDRTVMALNPVD